MLFLRLNIECIGCASRNSALKVVVVNNTLERIQFAREVAYRLLSQCVFVTDESVIDKLSDHVYQVCERWRSISNIYAIAFYFVFK